MSKFQNHSVSSVTNYPSRPLVITVKSSPLPNLHNYNQNNVSTVCVEIMLFSNKILPYYLDTSSLDSPCVLIPNPPGYILYNATGLLYSHDVYWSLGSDHFIIWGGGAGRVVFSRLFFHLMFKAGFFFHTPVWSQIFFSQRIESQIIFLFFYSHVSSQRYSHYFQGWGKIIFFATYQSKKIFSTYRLGQIIFFGQKQRQIIFSKTLPAPPPPDNEMVAPLCARVLYIRPAVRDVLYVLVYCIIQT